MTAGLNALFQPIQTKMNEIGTISISSNQKLAIHALVLIATTVAAIYIGLATASTFTVCTSLIGALAIGHKVLIKADSSWSNVHDTIRNTRLITIPLAKLCFSTLSYTLVPYLPIQFLAVCLLIQTCCDIYDSPRIVY